MFLGSYVVIAVLVLFPGTLCVTYSIAVTSHHVKPIWPYISYTGNRPVESCIFSLAFSLCSALFVVIVVLRFVQLCDVIEKSEVEEAYARKIRIVNLFSAVLGVLGAFGLSVTSSFQQRNFICLHLIGVFFCTYSTLLYFITQTYLTFKLASLLTKLFIKIVRLIATLLSGLILIAGPIIAVYGFHRHPHKLECTTSTQRQNDTGIDGPLLEWALSFFNFLFIASFYPDLKQVSLTNDQIIFLRHAIRFISEGGFYCQTITVSRSLASSLNVDSSKTHFAFRRRKM